jgi:hypothetical protein
MLSMTIMILFPVETQSACHDLHIASHSRSTHRIKVTPDADVRGAIHPALA